MAAQPLTPRNPGRRSALVFEWFRLRFRPLPIVLGVSMLTNSVAPLTLSAQQPRFRSVDANPKPTAQDQEGDSAASVKLNYFNATWETVLKDIATSTGSTLVADRVPTGRFTRRDREEYTRAEAIRIINREVEKLGFRVLEKGEYLVVVDLPSQRPRYERPTVGVAKTNPAAPANYEPITQQSRQFDRVTPARPEAGNRSQNGIQQAAHTEPATERSGMARAMFEDAPAAEQAAGTVVVFRARNQRATELAKQVYRTFRDRAELVEAGRNGLPAFRVHGAANAQGVVQFQFSVAIDEQREELLIDARPAEADAVLKLLRRLDAAPMSDLPVQLISTTKTACALAAQLPERAAQIQAARARAGLQDDRLAQVDAADPSNPAMKTDAAPGGPIGDVIGNLKGEVKIEAVEDLGVMILQGSEKDVEQVMRVIRELERLSEQTAPQIHLLMLSHVNSEALAELLTTVYESLTKFPGKATQPRQSVAILPVSKPNAVLIVAPQVDLQSILDLAEELDKPVDPETEFQVFHLQTAIATQVETLITEFYEERKGLGARVLVRSDVRSNSVIVQAKPRDLDEVATLIRKIDRDESAAVNRMQIFPLKNAVATELSAVLNSAIQSVLSPPSNQGASSAFGQAGAGLGGGQVAEEFQDVKSTALQFLAIDAAGERLLKSGILADIRITPDPRMNALLVSAPENSLTLISELIKQLDRPTSAVAEIKVFTLANADAQLMVQQLQALFNAQQTGGGQNNAARQLGVQVAGAEDASSGLIPIRFSVDTRTNSVIAIGAADALQVVEAIMLRLDESDIRDRQNSVYRLKNSPAQTIADAVTQFLTGQRDLTQQDPNLVSTVEQLEREVIVVPEPVSNSLLISATPRYNSEILKLIQKLDEAPQQVIIQALLVEVELNDTDEFGIELGFQDSILFDRSIVDNLVTTNTTTTQNNTTVTQTNIISQSSSPGYLFGNPATPLGNNTSPQISPNQVGSQGLSNFSLGRTNGDLGFGGLVLSASSESVSFLLRALSENRQVRVLSRPQIRTLDNQQAQILQGQNVPIVQGVTLAATGVASPNVTRDDAGVILTVTPRISPDGNVVMALTAEKSQYNLNNGVPIFTDANTGNVVTSPVKDISTATTTVSVPNGQTIVMGGLITSRTDEVHRKVPWLGDIPILGYAFRYDFLQTRRTELLVFLTPRIICDDAESEHIKEVEMSRIHFLEHEAEEIHGPLRGIPADELMNDGFPMDGYSMPTPPLSVPQSPLPVPPAATNTTPMPIESPKPALPKPPAAEVDDATPASPPPPSEAEARRGKFRPASAPMKDAKIQQAGAEWSGSPSTSNSIEQAIAEFEAPAKSGKSTVSSDPKSTQKSTSAPASKPKSDKPKQTASNPPAAVKLGRNYGKSEGSSTGTAP